ncbi:MULTISPECIES: hypothetical protein [unclassified Bradyrhizobium]|uniref:hypothetical protein n=1 Tax=unclassified Bradyrhizobium TaxID=2631580 RepID=UPI002916853F|nr:MULTISPECIES: hypothetical protein [unclassified Bradyrhizobium]
MLRNAIFALGSLSLLAGCAIHPAPEDVTGVDTVDIVKQIRCETREALTQLIKVKLEDWANRGSPEAARLSQQYASDPETISDFGPGQFPGPEYVEVRRFIKVFAETAIAYNFELTMTENNDLTTDIGLVRPLLSPKVTLGISAGAKRKRSNLRTFTTADTFGYLISQLNRKNRYDEHYCDGKVVRENYIYPLSGRVGIDKTVVTFVELSVFGSLGGEKGKGPPTMADKLTFTTVVNISANPKIEFTPVTSAFQLASAGLNANADRTDTHQVSVGLSLGDSAMADLGALRTFGFSPERGPMRSPAPVRYGLYHGERVTGGGTPAEQRAVEAIDQLKRRELQLIPPP